MTTTTSLIHHKPPPLKTRNDNHSAADFLRANNYYGSIGRPSHGRRKSAVELLQESKAFYVKSESVLDTKQELKNAEHLHVRSPTVEMGHPPYRGQGQPPPSAPPSVGGSSFPYGTFSCGTCPPYPHEHLDHVHNSLQLMRSNYLNSLKKEYKSGSKVTAKITLIDTATVNNNKKGENWDTASGNKPQKSNNKATRRSIQPPGSLQIVGSGGGASNESSSANKTNNSIGAPLTFTSFSQNGSLYTVEKHSITANLPVITSVTISNHTNHGGGMIRERKEDSSEVDSPPPLPPKSPRTTSKPTRPHDFPQRLNNQQQQQSQQGRSGGVSGAPDSMLPPPPPRRNHHDSSDVHSKLRRLVHEQNHSTSTGVKVTSESIIPPMTLPSPILPPTPPPDVVMESPMSDSGPIISPPPAFSTPVTPMLDRQNSSVSDRSIMNGNNPYGSIMVQKAPLSAAVSMSGVSSISSKSHKSIPDDVSMRYSPRSRLSSSSPMSHQDIGGSSGRGSGSTGPGPHNSASSEEEESEEAISADLEGDDDDSSRVECLQLSRNNSKKSTSSACAGSGSGGGGSFIMRSSPANKLLISSTSTSGGTVIQNHKSTITTRDGGTKVVQNKSTHHHHHKSQLPKSVTENFLCRSADLHSSAYHSNNQAAQTLPLPHPPKPRIVSPIRRPILRSKSDLSHRYIKAGRSATLTPGFTLVHVDLGQPTTHSNSPPPVPVHNSVSTSDFSRNYESHYHQPNPHPHHLHHHHHIYSRPSTNIHPSTGTYENIFQRNDLDRFFDQLGLDSKASVSFSPSIPLNKINKDKNGSDDSPVFFSSVSTVDSGARKSGSGDSEDSPIPPALTIGKIIGSRTLTTTTNNTITTVNNTTITTTNNNNNGPSIVVHHGEPSIVERNARVIKWLFNCRKALDSR